MKKYLYLILFFLVCVPAIAGTINSYTLKSPPDDADTIVIYDSDDGSTKKIEVGDISGSGSGINWSSYPDLTALTSAQEFLVNNAGTSSSINWEVVQTQLPWTDSGTSIYNTTTTDNVGIGTTIPSRPLDVKTSGVNVARFLSTSASGTGPGTANVRIGTDDGAALSAGDKFVTLDFFGSYNATGGHGSSAGITAYALSDWTASNYHSRLDFETTNSGSTVRSVRMSIANANVGIGSLNPSQKLDVIGTVKATAFEGDGSSLTGINAGGWTDGGTNIYLSDTTDNVAIGTTTPNSASLEIVKQSTTPPIKISSSVSAGGDYLIITSDGNIGINTLNPNQKMVINGNLRISDTDALYFGNNQYAFWVADAASNNGIRVYTNSIERFHINADGGIDINDSSTNGIVPLRVESDTDAYAFIVDGATDRVGIGTASPISKLEVNGLIVPDKVTADPCTVGQEGGIFYNDTSNYWCGCNGTDDVKLSDNSTACF